MQVSIVNDASFITISAREAKRLVLEAKAESNVRVPIMLAEAAEQVKDQMCYHFFGLIRHHRYRTQEEVIEFAPELHPLKMHLQVAGVTCAAIRHAAEYLLDNDQIPEEKKVINITTNDFRALRIFSEQD